MDVGGKVSSAAALSHLYNYIYTIFRKDKFKIATVYLVSEKEKYCTKIKLFLIAKINFAQNILLIKKIRTILV